MSQPRSIVKVKRQRRDDHVGTSLQDALQQAPPLVVQDLVSALARDDLRDQNGDGGVLVLDRLDVAKNAADQLAVRIEQHLDWHARLPLVPRALDLRAFLLVT